MMEISIDNLAILLENAINDGTCEELKQFLCNSGDEQYIDVAINKIGDHIKALLPTSLDSQSKITNILNIILGLAEIALFGPEKSEYLTRSLLNIAVDKGCSVYNLKHVLTMLKTFFTDEHIMQWSSTDESLFVPLKLLGVKLSGIGDYECQTILLETLWQISEVDRIFWADMWFANEKTRSMFLNLNSDQFALDCRKFLVSINRNEINQRTFAFVATSVTLGSISLRKPYGSDFWIDFNYDTESISFFCSSMDVENVKTWETISISSDMVDGYCIKNQGYMKTKELCIALKFPCSQLLSGDIVPLTGVESQVIRIKFWSFLDIHCHTEEVFRGKYSDSLLSGTAPAQKVSDCAEVVSFCSEEASVSKSLKQKRRVSESIDLVCLDDRQKKMAVSQRHHKRGASDPVELLCASYPEERMTSSQPYKQRVSESTELVSFSDPQEAMIRSRNHKRRRVSQSATLVSTFELQINTVEDEVHKPDYDMRNRRYTHCKKVSDGFVDSEDNFIEDEEEEEESGLLNVSNAKNGRQILNSICDKKFTDEIESEREQDVESDTNVNDDIDVRKNLPLSKGQNMKSVEIFTSYKDFQKDSVSEAYVKEDHAEGEIDNVANQHFSEMQEKSLNISTNTSEDDHNLNSEDYNNFNDDDSTERRNFDPGSSKVQEKADCMESCNNLTNERSSQSEVKSIAVRKSPQVSIGRCLQFTPKRSQNVQLLEVPIVTVRKSSEVSVGRFLQSSQKSSQNVQLLEASNIPKRKSSQSVSDLDDTCAISPTPLNNKNYSLSKKLIPQTQKSASDHANENKSSKQFTGISTRLSLRKHRNMNECNNSMNISLNSQKKKRLYNINRAPVYDVPPSEKKGVNYTAGNVYTSALNSTLSPKETVGLNELAKEENKLYSSEKAAPKILQTKVVNSNSSTNKDSVLTLEKTMHELRSPPSVIEGEENHIQQNISPEIVVNNVFSAKEKENNFENEEENTDYQTFIDMECDTKLASKCKVVLQNINEHAISRGENSAGPSEAVKKDNYINSLPQKKHRRAAVTAMKRNKIIMEQKGSETSFELSQHTNQQNKGQTFSQGSEDDVYAVTSSKEKKLFPRKRKFFESRDVNENEVFQNTPSKRRKTTKTAKVNPGETAVDEYAFCTPPPLVKRRSHRRSIFVTDTETGSSEVSWFSKFKLFETPKKSYSNRKKIKETKHKKNTGKPKLRKTKNNLKTHQTPSQRSKASDSTIRSKSALSELEKFSLVIEKNKRSLPANALSGLCDAMKSDRNFRQSNTEDIRQDYPLQDSDADNEIDESIELNEDYELYVSENPVSNANLKETEIMNDKPFLPSTSMEVSSIEVEPNIFFQNKNIKLIEVSDIKKNNEPSKGDSNSQKRSADSSTLKQNHKRNKGVQNLLGIELDSLTLSENAFKKTKNKLHQESEKNLNNSFAMSWSTTNKNAKNINQNLPLSLECLVEAAPFNQTGDFISGRWVSPNKLLENQYERPISESKNVLTEESLSPFNDEKLGKKMHLDHFLESLSSMSTNPQNNGVIELIDISETLEKSRTKPCIEESNKKHSFKHSMPTENTLKHQLPLYKSKFPAKHYEYNAASPSLQSKSLPEIVEEEHSEKGVSNNDVFESPFQVPSSTFQKIPSKDKMSCEDKSIMKLSVLHTLSDEVTKLTHRLFLTLKKCMSDFREKMVALRVSIVKTANSMVSNESKFTKQNLESLSRNCRESRIQIQKHLKKLQSLGKEYFESEIKLERRLSKKHKKAVLKYSKSLQIAQSIAEKALEERFLLKSRVFFKSFLKKMELV